AASDVFSGDPSKKFDVIFAIDMRELLTGLGMKQSEVDKIMATAEANAKKNVVNTASTFFSSLQGGGQQPGAPGAHPGMSGAQGMEPGMQQGGAPGVQQGGDDQAAEGGRGGGRRRGQGGGGGFGGGGGQGGQGGRGAEGGGRGAFANLSDEDRQKMRDL